MFIIIYFSIPLTSNRFQCWIMTILTFRSSVLLHKPTVLFNTFNILQALLWLIIGNVTLNLNPYRSLDVGVLQDNKFKKHPTNTQSYLLIYCNFLYLLLFFSLYKICNYPWNIKITNILCWIFMPTFCILVFICLFLGHLAIGHLSLCPHLASFK